MRLSHIHCRDMNKLKCLLLLANTLKQIIKENGNSRPASLMMMIIAMRPLKFEKTWRKMSWLETFQCSQSDCHDDFEWIEHCQSVVTLSRNAGVFFVLGSGRGGGYATLHKLQLFPTARQGLYWLECRRPVGRSAPYHLIVYCQWVFILGMVWIKWCINTVKVEINTTFSSLCEWCFTTFGFLQKLTQRTFETSWRKLSLHFNFWNQKRERV